MAHPGSCAPEDRNTVAEAGSDASDFDHADGSLLFPGTPHRAVASGAYMCRHSGKWHVRIAYNRSYCRYFLLRVRMICYV